MAEEWHAPAPDTDTTTYFWKHLDSREHWRIWSLLSQPASSGLVNSGIHNSMHMQLVLEGRRSLKCLPTRNLESSLFLGRQKEKEAKVKQSAGKGVEINSERQNSWTELARDHMLAGLRAPTWVTVLKRALSRSSYYFFLSSSTVQNNKKKKKQ